MVCESSDVQYPTGLLSLGEREKRTAVAAVDRHAVLRAGAAQPSLFARCSPFPPPRRRKGERQGELRARTWVTLSFCPPSFEGAPCARCNEFTSEAGLRQSPGSRQKPGCPVPPAERG